MLGWLVCQSGGRAGAAGRSLNGRVASVGRLQDWHILPVEPSRRSISHHPTLPTPLLPCLQVLGLDLRSSGLLSVLPWVTMALAANVGGWIADTLVERGWSVTHVRKIMQTVSASGGWEV